MEEDIFKEISDWQIEEGIKYHVFEYYEIADRDTILRVLYKFINTHNKYYICDTGEEIRICKKT